MSELRYNPLDASWVLVSEERGRRPSDFKPFETAVVDRTVQPCPFCLIMSGDGAARVVGEYRTADDRALAVANLYPALRIEVPETRHAVGPWDAASGVGAHEVIIETCHHDTAFRDLPVDAATAILRLWRDRGADLNRDRRMRWVTIFRNEGPEAGATLEHAHSQVLATPVWPPRLGQIYHSAETHYRHKERCLTCDIIEFERSTGTRVVATDGDFVAFCPYASRHAFEVWVAPIAHDAIFTRVDDQQLKILAGLIQRVLKLVHLATHGAPVNLAVHTAPNADAYGHRDMSGLGAFWHWCIELIPRTHRYGGLEIGSGLIVNPTAPEAAAAHLRKLDAKADL